jgi:hypothetical protein
MERPPTARRRPVRALGACALALGLLHGAAAAGLNEQTRQFVLANLQFTLLHELAHVLMAEIDIPVLGREEDAADQIAAVALLNAGRGRSARADSLLAAADGWLIEWHLEQDAGSPLEYWDSHPLDIQRYYNIACLLYGSDSKTYAGLQDTLHLPYQRAWWCEDEYRRALKTMHWMDEHNRQRRIRQRALRTARIEVLYEPPASADARALYQLVKESGVMEDAARLISTRYALPYDVRIVLTNICGAAAYWRVDLREVIVCYRLIERFVAMARLRRCVTGGPLPARRPEPGSQGILDCIREELGSGGIHSGLGLREAPP